MFRSAGLTTLLALGSFTGDIVAVLSPAPRSDPSISWGGCESFGLNLPGIALECAYFEVPMDYHDSSAGNARLALTKLPATAKKLGTIFFSPGGPGGSGVQAVAALAPIFAHHFQGSFDIVSWDARGVGLTSPGPVYCFNSVEEDAGFWNYTPVAGINETISGKFDSRDLNKLYSKASLTDDKSKELGARCQSGPSGPYLKYLGTSSTVRDLAALGDAIVGKGEPINFWGISYSSVLGFNFANMFPDCVGHMILDGVTDMSQWITYQFLHHSLHDIEKTYSGLTDGCAKAGRVGCKLIEITGDNASGGDVKVLLNYAHDVSLELYRNGYPLPILPAPLRTWLFNVLLTPSVWSEYVNGWLYQAVGFILQTARANNITVPCNRKYNVPSGNITVGPPPSPPLGPPPIPGLTPYTMVAIPGADDFSDNKTTIKDIFDAIVDTTREVTPTFGTVWSLGYASYGWPVRSVEQLPPYKHKKLKNPILLVANSADPITPLSDAKKTAKLLGDNASLLEQLGVGHMSIAQMSACTGRVMYSYLANSTLPSRGAQCPVDDPDVFPPLS